MSIGIGEGKITRGFALPASLDVLVRQRCEAEKISYSLLVRRALEKYLEVPPPVIKPRRKL